MAHRDANPATAAAPVVYGLTADAGETGVYLF